MRFFLSLLKSIEPACFFIFLLCNIPCIAQIDSAIIARPFVINNIIITGNNCTKAHIVHRELVFHTGDTLPKEVLENAIARSKENLLNMGLFNFVEIKQYEDLLNRTDIHIDLTERWYLWPLPFFEVVDRNFNEWWLTRDLNRTNYGMYLAKENFRGRDESLRMQVRLGYSQRLGFLYNIPYINKGQNVGLTVGTFFTRNREVAYTTEENKLRYFKDENNFIRKEISAFARLTQRNGIYDYYSLEADYRIINVQDTIPNLNNDFFENNGTMQQQISLTYSYRHDKRDYQPYPLKGYLFDISISKTGFGILRNEPEILGIYTNYRQYFEWFSRLHSSVSLKTKLTGKSKSPYVNYKALGYGSDALRGYEYYVINGKDFLLIKANLLKYTLMKTQVYNLSFIRSKKFKKVPNTIYISLATDVGYVNDKQFEAKNPLSNKWLIGYGAGIDYVTYYDMVFRFEYSFNHLGENGFFVNFAAPF